MREIKFSKINILLFLVLILSILLSYDVSAGDKDMFCISEEIQNFENMGIDTESSIFYFLSDNKIYNVYTWYNKDDIYYYDKENKFEITNNYMTISYLGEDGKGYIEGYSPSINMYDYNNSCILKVNENIKIKDSVDSYLTNDGLKTINDYTNCFESYDNSVLGNICSLWIINGDMFEASLNSPVLSVLVGLFIITSEIILVYYVSEVFKRL